MHAEPYDYFKGWDNDTHAVQLAEWLVSNAIDFWDLFHHAYGIQLIRLKKYKVGRVLSDSTNYR